MSDEHILRAVRYGLNMFLAQCEWEEKYNSGLPEYTHAKLCELCWEYGLTYSNQDNAEVAPYG